MPGLWYRAVPELKAHSPGTAQRPRVRALRAAFPAQSPLLPALTRSLRAASIFPTSPPHRATGRGREHYGSTTRVNRQQGGPIRKRTGGNPEPPRPRKTTARFQVFPRPPFLPPQHDSARRAHDQGKRKASHNSPPVTGNVQACDPRHHGIPLSVAAHAVGAPSTTGVPLQAIRKSGRDQLLTSAAPGRRTAAKQPGRTAIPGRYGPSCHVPRSLRGRGRPRRNHRRRSRCSWTSASSALSGLPLLCCLQYQSPARHTR